MKTSPGIKNRIRAIGRFLLVGLILLIPGYFFLYPQLFHCETIRFSDFTEIKKGVYGDGGLRVSDRKQIIKVISTAEMRIDSFWSGRKARPVIIVCSTPEQYEKYCSTSEGDGCSLGSPWGDSFMILNSTGADVDVASHEMSHVELLTRAGWWKTTMQIPQWFNEGLALMVDRRFVNNPDPAGRYLDYMDEWLYLTRGGQEILELKEITSIKGFFSGDQQQVMLAYMSSGMEVSYWLSLAGQAGFDQLIDALANGKSFSESYVELEKAGKNKAAGRLPVNPLRFRDPGKTYE